MQRWALLSVSISCIIYNLLASFIMGDCKSLYKANNEFAINFFKELLRSDKSNIFISPTSICLANGIIYLGSNKNTKSEIAKVFGFQGYEDESIHHFYKEFIESFIVSSNLNVATSILAQKDMPLLETFKDGAISYYKAKLEEVDIKMENSDVIEKVNEWVKKETNGKISHLLDSLEPDVSVLILNAIYFREQWKCPFEPEFTILQEFYNNGTDIKLVPMMSQTDIFSIAFDEDAQVKAIELPYKDSNHSMLIIIPEERNGLENLEAQLDLTLIERIISELRPMRIHVTMPKFKLEYGGSIGQQLKNIGMVEAFDKDKANFTKMSRVGQLYISEIIHKATVEVDEVGTEASAATLIKFSLLSVPPSITINHPFIFIIQNFSQKMILFIGKVTGL